MKRFTLDEAMAALNEAFAQLSPRTGMDCELEQKFREVLVSRRAQLKDKAVKKRKVKQ